MHPPSAIDAQPQAVAPTGTRTPERVHGAAPATPGPGDAGGDRRLRVAVLIAGSLVLAALSLLAPSTPTYDPYAWIIWGREIAHLDLNTDSGPSWKPLPVMFTTVFSVFGDAAPGLWLVIARAGGLLAVAMAFRLGRRLAGAPAGVAGALALGLSPWLIRNSAMGNSEGLLIALALWGVEAHLDARRGRAAVLGFCVALLRPEAWPLLGLYGLWLWRAEPGRRPLLAGLAVALPVLWLAPEKWGSGNLWRASDRAQDPNPDSAAFADRPALAVLDHAQSLLTIPLKVGVGVAIALAVAHLVRRGRLHRSGGAREAPDARHQVMAALAAVGLAWLAVVALMTEAGYSGNPRYLMLPAAIACLLGAVGAVALVRAAVRRTLGAGRGARAARAGAIAVAVIPAAALALPQVPSLEDSRVSLAYQADLERDLRAVIDRTGGAERLLACGQPFTGPYQVPQVAWHLGLHGIEVGLRPRAPAVVLRAAPTQEMPPAPSVRPLGRDARPIARVGAWEVIGACRTGAR
jgi:hypothetical protein